MVLSNVKKAALLYLLSGQSLIGAFLAPPPSICRSTTTGTATTVASRGIIASGRRKVYQFRDRSRVAILRTSTLEATATTAYKERLDREETSHRRTRGGSTTTSKRKTHISPSPRTTTVTKKRPMKVEERTENVHGIVLTTFNLLAPCYKRVESTSHSCSAEGVADTQGGGFLSGLKEKIVGKARPRPRESEYGDMWRARAEETLDFVTKCLATDSDIICFQEFWFDSEYQELFKERLGQKYSFHTFQRTGLKADGIAVLLRRDRLEALASAGTALGTVGNRVALLLHVQKKGGGKRNQPLILVNTHLTFPHNPFDRQAQRDQVEALTTSTETFIRLEGLPSSTPRMLVGDFNVGESDPACDHLRAAGYRSAFSSLHSKDRRIVTHRNHLGEEVMVDHVWIRGGKPRTIPEMQDPENLPEDRKLTHTHAYTSDNRHVSGAVRVREAQLLPRDIDDSRWSSSFQLSDHRPLQVGVDLHHCEECEI